tara:strand:+ start:13952 stop:16213 length:2262 start_codon:yes stop_codon:yes gene_type:complete
MTRHADESDHDEEGGEAGSGAHFVPYVVASVWRFRLLVVLAAGVGLAFGLFGALISPNQYRSVGKLRVLLGIRESITPESAISGTDSTARKMPVREAILNELQVLSAPELFDKVVAKVGADKVLAPYKPPSARNSGGPWHVRTFHALQSWWFQSAGGAIPSGLGVDRDTLASLVLQRAVRIYPEAGTNVISIAYESHSPELARIVVEASRAAAQEIHREVFNAMTSLGPIDEVMKRDEGLARSAENALREFRAANGIYDFESQRNGLLQYLGQLDQQIDTINLEAVREKARHSQLTTLKNNVSPDRPVRSARAPNPLSALLVGDLQQLRQRQLNLEGEKRNLSNGEFESRQASLAKLIKEKETQLEQELAPLQPDERKEANPRFESLVESLDECAVLLEGLEKQLVAQQAARKKVASRLAEFDSFSPALLQLEQDAQQKRAKADRLAEGVASMQSMQQLDSNVKVMHDATFEPFKVGPERGKRVFMGGLFGGAIGAMLALLLAFRNPRVSGRQDLQMLGLPSDTILQSSKQRVQDVGAKTLPPAFVDVRADIAEFWTVLPYDRREKAGLKIAVLPCGDAADASRAAATLAIGLALHAGERVIYVSCAEQDTWFAERAGLSSSAGWAGVLMEGRKLERAIQATPVAGLSYLPIGPVAVAQSHPMAAAGLVGLLDDLSASHRFVVLELPPLDARPEARALLGIADAVQLVVCKRRSEKASVRGAVKAVRIAEVQLLGTVLQEPRKRRQSRQNPSK